MRNKKCYITIENMRMKYIELMVQMKKGEQLLNYS